MAQSVRVGKYVVRFGIVNLTLLIGLAILLPLLKAEPNMGATIGALMGAAMAVVYKFIQDNKRAPTPSERSKLIWLSYLASLAVSLFQLSIAAAFTDEGVQIVEQVKSINMSILIGAMVFVSAVYLGILSLSYGYLARKQFEGLQAKGKI